MTLTHKPISGIVSNLCKEFSVRKKAIDLGAVPALVALLSAPQPQLLKNALTALLLLCGDYKGRDQVMAADPSQAPPAWGSVRSTGLPSGLVTLQ